MILDVPFIKNSVPLLPAAAGFIDYRLGLYIFDKHIGHLAPVSLLSHVDYFSLDAGDLTGKRSCPRVTKLPNFRTQ